MSRKRPKQDHTSLHVLHIHHSQTSYLIGKEISQTRRKRTLQKRSLSVTIGKSSSNWTTSKSTSLLKRFSYLLWAHALPLVILYPCTTEGLSRTLERLPRNPPQKVLTKELQLRHPGPPRKEDPHRRQEERNGRSSQEGMGLISQRASWVPLCVAVVPWGGTPLSPSSFYAHSYTMPKNPPPL